MRDRTLADSKRTSGSKHSILPYSSPSSTNYSSFDKHSNQTLRSHFESSSNSKPTTTAIRIPNSEPTTKAVNYTTSLLSTSIHTVSLLPNGITHTYALIFSLILHHALREYDISILDYTSPYINSIRGAIPGGVIPGGAISGGVISGRAIN